MVIASDGLKLLVLLNSNRNIVLQLNCIVTIGEEKYAYIILTSKIWYSFKFSFFRFHIYIKVLYCVRLPAMIIHRYIVPCSEYEGIINS